MSVNLFFKHLNSTSPEDANVVKVVPLVIIERCVVGKKKNLTWIVVEDWFVQPEGQRGGRIPSVAPHPCKIILIYIHSGNVI